MDTILLVDDDPQMLMLTETFLSDEGYRVLKASDGAEAQEFLSTTKEEIATIILDWSMPRMNGIELLQWMKTQSAFEQIPVVMLTAMASSDHIRQGIEAGAFYYLVKPADPKLIRSIVAAAVSDFRLKQDLTNKLKESENPYQWIDEATFRFRSLAEGEYIAVRIANAASSPQYVIGISEMITNAIEHGNLGITYREKSELVEKGEWLKEIERRLNLPENVNKYVHLTLKRRGNTMTVLIEDQGPGFDWTKYLEMDEVRVFDNHGRGIAITNKYLKLEYLGTGNKVLLTMPL
ncbi:MAG TPA: response regulator [Bacteroidota bacterium]|nr:response regulator [Bacteroidota bacterium]